MALKSATGKLYTLFSACLPDDENIKRRLLIDQIVESKEYRELKNYEPMNKLFERLFSKTALSKLSVVKLQEVEKAIPLIIPAVYKIINSIKYGDAWKLTNGDLPDFYSQSSLEELSDKINADGSAINITNITENNFLAIFSDKTVKSVEMLQGSLTVSDLKDINEAIKVKLKGKSYCINENDVNNIKCQFDIAMEEMDKYDKSIKYQKHKQIESKIVITAIIILFSIGIGVSGLLHPLGLDIFLITAVIATVIYWIKG